MAMRASRFPGSGTLIEQTRMRGHADGLVEGRIEGRIEGRTEGRAESRAEDILRVLELRGIQLSEADQERIKACTDLGTLRVWFDRAVTVAGGEELFAGT